MKHTPTPYRVGKLKTTVVADSAEGKFVRGATGPDAVEYYGGNLIAESVSEANAEFIVEACNNYEALATHLLMMIYAFTPPSASDPGCMLFWESWVDENLTTKEIQSRVVEDARAVYGELEIL